MNAGLENWNGHQDNQI